VKPYEKSKVVALSAVGADFGNVDVELCQPHELKTPYGSIVCMPVISAPNAMFPLPTCIGVTLLLAFRCGLNLRTMLSRLIAQLTKGNVSNAVANTDIVAGKNFILRDETSLRSVARA